MVSRQCRSASCGVFLGIFGYPKIVIRAGACWRARRAMPNRFTVILEQQVRAEPLRRGSAILALLTRGPRPRRTAIRPPSLPFWGKFGTVPATGVPPKPLRVYPVTMAGKARQGSRIKAKGPRAQAAEITDAMRLLLSPETTDGFQRQRALFAFVCHLRWPEKPKIHKLASDIFFVKYIADRFKADQSQAANLVIQYVDFSEFISQLTSEIMFDIDFKFWPPGETRNRTVANIVRFLISWGPQSDSKIDAPSVNKAYFFIGEYSGYGSRDQMSWKRFSELWKTYKPVCFFMFVNEYYFERRLLLDPGKPDFAASVDSLLSDQAGLEQFLGQSLFVLNKLRAVLYRSVWKGVPTPEFPDGLEPLPVKVREPDKAMKAVMAQYEKR